MEVQWSLVIFTLFAGAGAWTFALMGIDRLRGASEEPRSVTVSSIVSFALLVVGGLASVAHLSHPDRILAALNHPTSGIFMEALLLGLLCVAIAIFFVAWKREASPIVLKAVLVVGIVLAVSLSFAVGYSYIMAARPAWNTIMLPIGYVFTAASCGAAVRLVVLAVTHQDAKTVSSTGLALGVASVASCCAVLAYGAASGVFASDQAVLFGGLAVFVGALVPAALGFAAFRKPESAFGMGCLALLAAFVGAGAFRAAMWLLGAGIVNYFGAII